MKIRTGFVSNSSSSSFIVAFDKVPQTVKEMQKVLFGNKKEFENPYSEGRINPEYSWPVEEIAEIVFNEMKEGASDDKAIETVMNGYFEGHRSLSDFKTDPTGYDFVAYDIANRKLAKEIFDNFRKLHPDAKLFIFSYGDNDSQRESSMEHGNLFGRVPHLYVSNH